MKRGRWGWGLADDSYLSLCVLLVYIDQILLFFCAASDVSYLVKTWDLFTSQAGSLFRLLIWETWYFQRIFVTWIIFLLFLVSFDVIIQQWFLIDSCSKSAYEFTNIKIKYNKTPKTFCIYIGWSLGGCVTDSQTTISANVHIDIIFSWSIQPLILTSESFSDFVQAMTCLQLCPTRTLSVTVIKFTPTSKTVHKLIRNILTLMSSLLSATC